MMKVLRVPVVFSTCWGRSEQSDGHGQLSCSLAHVHSLAPLRSLVIQVAIVSREEALSFTRDRRRPADASAEHRETGGETLGNENERTLTGLPARSLIHSATTL